MQIKKDVLAYRFGGETAEQWLAIFREYRWDLEEEAEALILAQQEDDHGWIWLS
ncbi:periplasmic protein [Salmonella enterica subsp. enterica serovar Heidelberg str. RI-11-014316]|nr:periplasmic protein [Salmonella enterica subsp. enterica serovar Heidelberg str. RI-11-014316]